MPNLTRRQTTALLLATAPALLVPSAVVAETEEALAFKLGEALNGRLKKGCGGAFTVTKFKLGGTRKNVVMHAAVKLDWPPGTRIRPFRSVGTSQQEAIVAMFRGCLKEFGGAWPGCVRV